MIASCQCSCCVVNSRWEDCAGYVSHRTLENSNGQCSIWGGGAELGVYLTGLLPHLDGPSMASCKV